MGLFSVSNSPKAVLREAFSAGLINDDEVWLEMLNDRNITAHIYSENLSIEICNNIKSKYLAVLGYLLEQISERIGLNTSDKQGLRNT